MVQRRALLVAPEYDGHVLAPLAGAQEFLDACTPLLKERGSYGTVNRLEGKVSQPQLRGKLADFFDSDGELLFYFYGHGVLRPPSVGILATSDAAQHNEGVQISELLGWSRESRAREVVIILDCCHAGATTGRLQALSASVASTEATTIAQPDGPKGRAFIAACHGHQKGWEAPDEQGRLLGALTRTVLNGLQGEACGGPHSDVRASSLGTHVTAAFSSWNQSPIAVNAESGERPCIIIPGEVAKRVASRPEVAARPPDLADVAAIEALTHFLEVEVALAKRLARSPKRRGLAGRALAESILEPRSLRKVAHPFMLAMEYLKDNEGSSWAAAHLKAVFERVMVDVGQTLARPLPGGSGEPYVLDVGDSAVLEPGMAAAAFRPTISYWVVDGRRCSTYEVGAGGHEQPAIEVGMVVTERVVRTVASVATKLEKVRVARGLRRSPLGPTPLTPNDAQAVETLLKEIRSSLMAGSDLDLDEGQKSEYFTVIHDPGEPQMREFADRLANEIPQLRVVYSVRGESNEEESTFVKLLDNIYGDYNTIANRNG